LSDQLADTVVRREHQPALDTVEHQFVGGGHRSMHHRSQPVLESASAGHAPHTPIRLYRLTRRRRGAPLMPDHPARKRAVIAAVQVGERGVALPLHRRAPVRSLMTSECPDPADGYASLRATKIFLLHVTRNAERAFGGGAAGRLVTVRSGEPSPDAVTAVANFAGVALNPSRRYWTAGRGRPVLPPG
jgi:hypothetical protein